MWRIIRYHAGIDHLEQALSIEVIYLPAFVMEADSVCRWAVLQTV